jgi:hypothetical protein
MFLKPALGEVKVRGFELPLDLYMILRDESSDLLPKRPARRERCILVETPVAIRVINIQDRGIVRQG